MKRSHRDFPVTLLVLTLLGAGWAACAAPGKPAKAAQDADTAPVEAEIPQSVFVIPSNPKEGRNPFFPQSMVVAPVAKVHSTVLDTSGIILNGVTSRPTPSVMINGVTFEKGEEHEVKLAGGGRVKVRCEDIHDDSASIRINGVQLRELRLRTGL